MASKKLLTADFAIEGYKPNDRAGLWFVPLTDIAAGTEIVFSNFAKRSLAAAMTSPSYVAAANIAAGTITATGPATNAPTALIFIDSRVADLQTLVDGARPGTQVWVLNANFDGVQQIVEMLQSSGLHDLDSIHIVSHGAQGEVQLGATVLNAGNLAAHAHQLAEIGTTLTADGDLLLYGCDVAGGNAGLQFIADLAHATGADVAASTDATGSNAAGGDWVLEAGTGSIEAPAPFAPETLNSFSGVLANETFTVTQATTLKTDIDGDGLADPGDTVTTSVTITNNSTNTNAANVSFNETLVGMTQQGAVKVTPIAANDGGYTLVGNTPITFNAAQGVLANDVDPNGAGGNAGLTAINVVTDANTHGTVVLNNDGSFTYTPTTGYTGAATFQYTARDVEGLNSNQTGVVTLTVTDPVWYVDSAAAPAGADGSFLRPFQTLAQATAVDTANDTIFVYNRGANYTQATGITLEAGEQLLGDGSSLTTVNGNAVGASAVNSTFVVTGNSINALTLGSSNTLSGINISETGTAGNGIVSTAGGVGTLHLISVGVTTTGNGIVLTTGGTVDAAGTNTINSSGGTALNVTNTNIGASHLTFQSISAGTGANTASNGIVLNNTGAAGGLHVTGTGTAGSGGTIQHMTGADGNTGSGIGILLINTSGVQLDRMQLNDFQNFAILGNTVNGFTLANSTINGVNGASTGVAEGSVRFIQLTGTAAITNSTISATTTGTTHVNDTLHIENTSGTLNMTISGSTIANLLSSGANHAIFFGAPSGNGTMNLTMTGSNVTAAYQDLLRGDFQGNTTASINISGSQFRNTSEMTAGGTAGVTTNLVDLTGGGTSAASGVFVTYNINNNTFAHGDGVNAPLVSGGSSAVRIGEGSTVSSSFADFVGIFSGNTIGVSGVARSGAGNGADGLSVIHYRDETTAHGGSQVLIQNNTIQNYGEAGIKVGAQDGKLSADNDGSLDATIFGNIIRQPGAINDGAFAGIWGYAGNSVGDENVLNLVIGDALAAGNKNTLTNSDPNNSFDVFLGNVGIATAPINLSRNGSGSGTVNNATEAQVNAVLTADNVGPLDLTGNTVSPINLVTTLPVRPLFADTSIPAPDTASGSTPSPAADTQPVPAANTTANPGAVASQLAQTDLDNIVAAAILRWNATGLTADQQAYLYSVQFSVADMQGLFLGSAAPGHIIIDSDAAGYGWFLDATPSDDAEFGNVLSDSRVQANPGQLPNGHIDLLTAVMHELSHQLGLHDTYDPADRDSISYGYLVTGERRLPEAGQALGAIAGSIDHEEFAVGPVAIGTLPFGKSVTISFDATIDAQNNQLIVNPVNQGTVSGTAPFPAATNSNSVTTTLDTLTLGGTVWNDNGAGGGATGNGLKDGTEPGVDGVLLSLFTDANNDNMPDSPGAALATATTAGGGNYAFTGLAPGNYIVRVDQDNFDAGGNVSLLGLQSSSLGNPDPDNNVDNDDNGSRVVGQPAFTQAITLAYNTEPTVGTGNDTNNTLDLGFFNNALPVATTTGGATTFTEGDNAASTPVVVDAGLTVTDENNTTLASATVSISGGFQAGQDILAFINQNGIVGNYAAGTGILSLSGIATVAQYQTALRSVTYTNTSETPNTANRTVSFTVNDGIDASVASAKTVSITAVNDTPLLANTIPDLPATQIGNPFDFTFDANTFSDVDSVLTYSATQADNSALPLWLLFTGNTRTFSGTPQAGDVATLQVKVTATDGTTPISDTFTISVVTNQGLIVGTAFPDSLTGSTGSDTLVGAAGNDTLNGGLGYDSANYSGVAANHTITRNGFTTIVSGPDGTDTLTSVERLQFDGGGVRSLEHADRDFGNNGKSDILWHNIDGSVAVWQMDGFAQSNGAIVGSATTDWKIADGSGDYDGNGKSDILWHNDNSLVAIWQIDGLTFSGGSTFSSTSAGWKIADGSGDYNADGKSDVLLRHDNGNFAMWLMDGMAISSASTVSNATSDWKIADGAGDYNGDGKSDILLRNDNGNVAIWLMDGVTQIGGAIVNNATTDWKIVDGSGDYNGDGKSDILWHNDNGNVAIWQIDGLAINGASTFSSAAAGWRIADGSGDYDGNGKSDILLHHTNGNVGMWLMDGMVVATGSTISSASADWAIPD